MQLLRTPEERFDALGGFDHPPRHVEVPDPDGAGPAIRMATYTAGPDDAPTVLLLHGEPTWSYLYRTVIDVLVDAGLRAVAIDLVGFGRSDKPTAIEDHSYARHVDWVRAAAFEALDLRDVVLLGQDWGGLIGLRLVAEHPERFAGVVAANTGLPTGDAGMPAPWWAFRWAVEAAGAAGALDVGRLVSAGCTRGLETGARAAYDAPFPSSEYMAGPRAMPLLVPTRPDDPATPANRAAWAALGAYEAPFLTAFSDSDPITGPMGPILRGHVPGAAGREHPTLERAGHFVQEDAGAELGAIVAGFVRSL